MKLSDTQRQQLIARLLRVGWTRRGAFIVAPNESLCLPLALMPTGELGKFRDQIEQQCIAFDSAPVPAAALGDLMGTLEVLREFFAALAPVC